MVWTHALMQLQEADIEQQSNQKRLVELSHLLKDSSVVQVAQQRLEEANKSAKQARQDQETLEFELGKIQSKLSLATERLYSGRITNSRELQDSQAETESLKRHTASLEDKLLEAMLVREDADAQASDANTQAQRIGAETAEIQQRFTQEQTTLTARNEVLTKRMQELGKQIPASILDTYAYLKSRTGNLPVAQLKGQICGVCGIDVIKPIQQKARRDEEVYCGGCNRLLVVLD